MTAGNTASLSKGRLLEGGKCSGLGSFEAVDLDRRCMRNFCTSLLAQRIHRQDLPQRPVTLVTKGPMTICDMGGDQFPGEPPKRRNPALCLLVEVSETFPAFALLQTLGYQRISCGDTCQRQTGCNFPVLLNLSPTASSLIPTPVWEDAGRRM